MSASRRTSNAAAEFTGSRTPLDTLAIGTSFVLLLIVGWVLLPRGINLSDEGFLLQQALDMLDGKVLYRDIEMFIAPGIWFVVAALFSVVEPSVIASRLIAAVSYFGLAIVIFRLVATRAGFRYASATVAVYAVLAVWSFPHWTWAWYSPYSILFALLATHALLAWGSTGRASLLLHVGVYVGLTTIFKQNYGFFALVACLIGVVAFRVENLRVSSDRSWSALALTIVRDGLRIGAGLALALAPLLIYFGYHGALWSIYDRFVLYPLEFTTSANIPYLDFQALFSHDVFEQRVTSTNYLAQLALNSPADIALLPSPTAMHALHALLYWLPPIVMLLGFLFAFLPERTEAPALQQRRVDVPLLVCTTMAAVVFLGVFPRADFTHLVTVYQPVLVTGALVARRLAMVLAARSAIWSFAPISAGVALFGFYSLAAAAWLVYLTASMTERLPQPRGGVRVHLITAVGINQLVDVVRAHTAEGESFFGLPDMAMINFLSERDVPGSQYQTYAHMISRDEGALTAAQLHEANVDFIIARYDNVLSSEPRLERYAPLLADYLETNFESTWLIQNDQYILLERLDTPREAIERTEALDRCAFAGGDARESSVRQHLLFASLFQPLDPGTRDQAAETHCVLAIPEGETTLSFQLGYKHPIAVEPGATITGEIFVVTGSLGGSIRTKIFEQTMRVGKMSVDGTRVEVPKRVDLSRYAGSEITLAFRVRRSGRVKLSPFTLETYAVFWQAPMLEHRRHP